MLSTSLAVALTGALAVATPSQPNWQLNYSTAIAHAAEYHKPLAVFIAHGEGGFARVVADGTLPTDAVKLLKQGFVCVYVNTDTEGGKKLAGSFAMAEGLVISDRTGEKQALRHPGAVPPADLTRYLEKFGDPNRVVTTTEVQNVVTTPVAPAAVAAPAFYANPMSTFGNIFPGGACRT